MPDGQNVRFPDDMPEEEIRGFIFKNFPELAEQDVEQQQEQPQPQKLSQEQLADVEKRAKEYQKEHNMDTSGWSVAKEGLKGVGKGLVGGLERVASGLTFGGYDWASDKLGLGSRERLKELEQVGGTPMKFATKGTELVSGFGPTAKLTKVVGLPLAGAIEGGLSSGFGTDFDTKETAKGAAIGGAMGTALWGGGKLAKMAFGKRTAIKGVPRGLENAVQSDKGTKILDKAVKVDDKTARQVIDKAPEAMEEVNRRAIGALDKGLGAKTSVGGTVKQAQEEFGKFIAENGGVSLAGKNPSSLGLKGLTQSQKEALMSAWNSGKKDTLKGVGSLEHLQKTQGKLGDMINVLKRQGEKEGARNLTLLKKQVDEKISSSLLPEMRVKYSKAMRVRDAYEAGLEYNPNKVLKLAFGSQAEKNAFGQGLVEKITQNPEAKNIAGNVRSVKGALRKVMGEKADSTLKELGKLDEAYGRIVNLGRKSMAKTGRSDPNGLFAREQFETKGSLKGTIVDKINDILTFHKARGAANYLLNPNKTFKPSKYDKYVQPALLELLSTGVPSLNRKIQGE